MHMARTNARKFKSEISSDGNTMETISMPVEEYNALSKEKISKTIFEITYQNRRFDIYKTELKENSVILYARHDKQEDLTLKNLAASNNAKNLHKQAAPFYAFHFFLPEKLIFNSTIPINIHETISLNVNFPNYCSITSPPPDNEFA